MRKLLTLILQFTGVLLDPTVSLSVVTLPVQYETGLLLELVSYIYTIMCKVNLPVHAAICTCWRSSLCLHLQCSVIFQFLGIIVGKTNFWQPIILFDVSVCFDWYTWMTLYSISDQNSSNYSLCSLTRRHAINNQHHKIN